MRVGKLTNEELKDCVIDVIGAKRPEVLSSAGISKDCAAVKCGDIILLTSDPITASSRIAGKLAVLVSSNDVAAGGGSPFCCLLTVIAPSFATAEDIKAVMTEAQEQAAALNIDIVGGHTEFSPYVSRTIVSCTMLGRAKRLVGRALKEGDSILMTKYAGLEGTVILSNDMRGRLNLTAAEIAAADALTDRISVLEESRVAVNFDISLMHDVTEGGVFGAVREVCMSNGVGADIFEEKIPLLPVTESICAQLGLNPYKLISSGSMLIFCEEPDALIEALKNEGIETAKIGEIKNSDCVRAFKKDGGISVIDSGEDEISKNL
ncbi:MAG: AIR synthase [Clostridiales bacterium]|jgi:hydrogenase maturation factor|nr:AIR synthase [Clostridiales bacterium]